MARSASFIPEDCILFEQCGRGAFAKGYCLMHYKRVWRGGVAETTQKIPNGMSIEFNLNFHGYTVTEGGCWEWNGGRFASLGGRPAYGALYAGGETLMAHRASYEFHVGPIPHGMFACHSCDNPPCINPEHIFLGSNRDNMVDMYGKGRGNRPLGQAVHNSKLTVADVIDIRQARNGGAVSLGVLAEQYGVSKQNICHIAKYRSWKQVA